VTRLGAGGMPFLLPLCTRSDSGNTPVQSGLLIPQFLAAIRFTSPYRRAVLTRLGYRSQVREANPGPLRPWLSSGFPESAHG
jgi:hypothetical protein